MALSYPSISLKRLALGPAAGNINGQISAETPYHTVCLLKTHNGYKLRTCRNHAVQVF